GGGAGPCGGGPGGGAGGEGGGGPRAAPAGPGPAPPGAPAERGAPGGADALGQPAGVEDATGEEARAEDRRAHRVDPPAAEGRPEHDHAALEPSLARELLLVGRIAGPEVEHAELRVGDRVLDHVQEQEDPDAVARVGGVEAGRPQEDRPSVRRAEPVRDRLVAAVEHVRAEAPKLEADLRQRALLRRAGEPGAEDA